METLEMRSEVSDTAVGAQTSNGSFCCNWKSIICGLVCGYDAPGMNPVEGIQVTSERKGKGNGPSL